MSTAPAIEATHEFGKVNNVDALFYQQGQKVIIKPVYRRKDGSFTHSEFAIIPTDEEGFDYKLVISSQKGCSFACTPCASKDNEFAGNYTADEIIGIVQELFARAGVEKNAKVDFSGTGEGDGGVAAAELLKLAYRIPEELPEIKRIMISTAGAPGGIRQFTRAAAADIKEGKEPFNGLIVLWQISGHGEKNRHDIVPVPENRETEDLVKAAVEYYEVTGEPVRLNWMCAEKLLKNEKGEVTGSEPLNNRPEDVAYIAGLNPEAIFVTFVEVNQSEIAADFFDHYRACTYEERKAMADAVTAASDGRMNAQAPLTDRAAEEQIGCGQVNDDHGFLGDLARRHLNLININPNAAVA